MNQVGSSLGGTGMLRQPRHISGSSADNGTRSSRVATRSRTRRRPVAVMACSESDKQEIKKRKGAARIGAGGVLSSASEPTALDVGPAHLVVVFLCHLLGSLEGIGGAKRVPPASDPMLDLPVRTVSGWPLPELILAQAIA